LEWHSNLAGAEGFEPPSSVLETDSLTVELTPLNSGNRDQGTVCDAYGSYNSNSICFLFPIPWSLLPVLLRFSVLPVSTAALAELRELETAGGRLLVLRRCVVALLALGALQCHDFPHPRILTDSTCQLRRLASSNSKSQILQAANRKLPRNPAASRLRDSRSPAPFSRCRNAALPFQQLLILTLHAETGRFHRPGGNSFPASLVLGIPETAADKAGFSSKGKKSPMPD
jgi:hypothetical protein